MLTAKQFYKQYFNIDSSFDHQINLWEIMHAMEFPLLLKAPTGSGKTEAVLAPFLSQFIDNHFHIAPRMIYVLPMRVLVNSVAERIRKYTKKSRLIFLLKYSMEIFLILLSLFQI